MTDDIDLRLMMRHSQENPCNGTYTLLVPEDRDEADPLRIVRLEGMALRGGTYRVRFERIADA